MNKEQNSREILKKIIPKIKRFGVISFLTDLVIKALYLLPPILMKKIIDTYIPSENRDAIVLSVILFCIIPVVIIVLTGGYNYFAGKIQRNAAKKLSMIGVENVLRQDVSYFYDKNSAEVSDYCSISTVQYVYFWVTEIPRLFSSIISSLIAWYLLYTINVKASILIIVYIPTLLVPSYMFSLMRKKVGPKVGKNNAKAKQLIADSFRSVEFIKSLNIVDRRLKEIEDVKNDTVKVWSKIVMIDTLHGAWESTIVDNLFIGIIFVISALEIISKSLTTGELVMTLSYLPYIFMAIKIISATNFSFKKQLGEYSYLFDILNLEYNRKELAKIDSFKDSISFEDVSFRYSNEREKVLDRLNMSVRKGEWLGVIGESGVGKSTLINLLIKLIKPCDGTIRIDGKDISNYDEESIRSLITKVSQKHILFPGTIRDNLLIANPNATKDEIETAINDSGLTAFVMNLKSGLDTAVGEDGLTISGGEKQRIAIAQGLLRKSEILVLDEVTGNIDNLVESEIKDTIRKLVDLKKITVISISHRLDFLSKTDLINHIEDGKITDQGTYSDLKKNNKLFIGNVSL